MRSAANPTTTDGYDDGGDSQSGSATGDNFNSSFNAGTTDIDSDGDGDVSDTNDRARKRRREVRDKYEGILEFDRPPAAIARTVLICRMITGETMGAYTIDPWFPLNEQGFITLATDTWNRARQELSVEVRQRVSKHASVEVVEYLRAQPLGFRTQTMLRVRRTVPSVYGLNAAEPEKTRSEVQQLLRDFAFIARDPYKGTVPAQGYSVGSSQNIVGIIPGSAGSTSWRVWVLRDFDRNNFVLLMRNDLLDDN
ncbi:hypothetical protein NX059_003717 [Plenodomus lindquistii]|nr:hypothetical protein NX059_003717 [Plenodomus lindquistii]